MSRVDVYFIKTAQIEKLSDEFCQKHFPERKRKFSHFQSEESLLHSKGSGALLCALGFAEGDIFTSENGKPFCKTDKRHFNLSHSNEYIALAVSKTDVGVDIERISEERKNVARRMFTEREREYIATDCAARFTCLWTVKESISKLFGTGLSYPFSKMDVLETLNGAPYRDGDFLAYVSTTTVDGYTLSVAQREMPDVVLHPLTAEEVLFMAEGNS